MSPRVQAFAHASEVASARMVVGPAPAGRSSSGPSLSAARTPAVAPPTMRPSATIAAKNHVIDNRGTRPPLPAAAIVAALCMLIGSIAAGCIGGDDSGKGPGPTVTRAQSQGDPRKLRIGFTSLSPERTADAYTSTF